MKQPESNRIEHKETLTDELEKSVVAFLNAKGGNIYIGIDKKGSVAGVTNPDDMQLKIKDRLINNIRPSIMGLFDIFVEERDGKNIVVVNLAGGTYTPYYIRKYGRSEKGCFIRIGSASQPMTEEQVESMMNKRRPVLLTTVPARDQDLTFKQLRIFYDEKGLNLNANFAKSLDFLTADGKYNQLAYMFADNNRVSIRVAKWWGTDKIDLRENEEYGDCSLVKTMQKVLDKFELENITQARKVGIGQRQEKRLVDNKALREAIINAFAHNDYSSGDTPIFEIYADRFEITTYGNVLEWLKKEEFFTGMSRPRNPEIMRIFKDLEFVERLGSGMPYIVKKYGRRIFKFSAHVLRFAFLFDKSIDQEEQSKLDVNRAETTTNNTQKTPRKHPENTQKTPRKHPENTQKILTAIQKNPFITRQELVKNLSMTEDSVKWQLKKLKDEGILHRFGGDKGGHWEVVTK
ncbi:ATP-dependent DNA helicase [Candidatus Termititenax persephonae]|uniref:ATP-dependent DNA helicase n=1 Tax=Candidatus Termititenax persephonae TaxID=2218525 RepID=A0A388TJQ3_9BACT|nr:ATP-dependent DNA helicase [Candidatus Termititenax persephonae]